MSLINDALKRAQEDKSLAGGSPAPSTPPSPPQRSGSGSRKKLLAALVLLVAGGGAGAWYFFFSGAGAQVPKSAVAGVARPAAAAKTANAAKNAATLPAADLTAELREIIGKSVTAVNCYTPPDVGPVSPRELLGAFDPDSEEDSDTATPSPTPSPSSATQPVASPQARPGPARPAVPFDASKYKVSGVLSDGAGGAAVINGRIVRVGDTIDGARLIRISGKNAIVEVGGKEHVLGT